MPAFVIVDIDVHDPERYAEYIRVAPVSIAAYGGRYLVRGGDVLVLEGQWQPKRVVVLEFPSTEQARAWWSSAEFGGPKALRQSAAVTNMVLVEGVDRVDR